MGILLSIILSTLETAAVYMLIFSLFRIKQDMRLPLVLGLGVLQASLSYIMRMYGEYGLWDVPLQQLLSLLFIMTVYRVRMFYAVVMALTALASYVVLQSLLIFMLHTVFGIRLEAFDKLAGSGAHLIQSLSILGVLLITFWLRKWNGGFIFIPSNRSLMRSRKDMDRKLLALILWLIPCMACSFFGVMMYLEWLFFASFPPTLLLLIRLLYLFYLMDMNED